MEEIRNGVELNLCRARRLRLLPGSEPLDHDRHNKGGQRSEGRFHDGHLHRERDAITESGSMMAL